MYHHNKDCIYNKNFYFNKLIQLINNNDKENSKKYKEIVKLSKKLIIQNKKCIIQNIKNVQLFNYRDTFLSQLNHNIDYINSINTIKSIYNCVKTLTEKTHCSQNINIFISNLKNQYVSVYQNGIFIFKEHVDKINTLLHSGKYNLWVVTLESSPLITNSIFEIISTDSILIFSWNNI